MTNNKKYKYTQEEFLKIIYDLVGDEYTVLSDYNGNRNKILMRHNVCGNEWWITPSNFIEHGTRCPIENGKIKYSTKEYKQKLYKINSNLELLDEYTNSSTKLHFKCLKDNYVFLAQPKQVLQGSGCPCCAGRKVVIGINDLHTTNPEVSKFLNNYNDGLYITYGTHKKIDFKCPCCSSLKKCRPNSVLDINGKYKCGVCGDGVSYPEKFVGSVLEQLNIEYIHQLTHKNFSWIGKFKYDFYIPLYNLIIEVHGLQHYEHKTGWGETNVFDNDKIKYNLAIKNDIERYVVIDARYSEIDWLKENIIKELSSYFDLSKIDWKKCAINANKSLMVEVCKSINENSIDIRELEQKFKLTGDTIRKYIKEGSKIGLCSYDHYKSSAHFNKCCKISNALSHDVICLETGEIFKSITEINSLYKDIKLASIIQKPKQYGLTWEYYNQEKEYVLQQNFTIKEYLERYKYLSNIISKINQYDENMNYIKTFNKSKDLIVEGLSYGSISKYMRNGNMIYNSYWYYAFDIKQPSKEKVIHITPTIMDKYIIKGSYQKEVYDYSIKEVS